jgi:hypothetical protein
LRVKGFECGRKEISIFHHHVVPLVRDEIANNGIDILPKNFSIRAMAEGMTSAGIRHVMLLAIPAWGCRPRSRR